MNDLVSIILPVYNCADYLDSTIESVLNQTYSNFELLIIDDFSKDASVEIIKKYSGIDSRVKYHLFEKNSGGPARPRNKGLSLANGEYVAFIDADDIWHPQKTEIQLIMMNRGSFTFSSTRLNQFKDESRIVYDAESYSSDVDILDHDILLRKNTLNTSSVMVSKDFYPSIEFSELPEHIAIEDYVAWLNLHQNKNLRSAIIPNRLLFYRLRKDSISSSKFMMAKKIYRLLKEYKVDGKCLGIKRYYYFLTYILSSLRLQFKKKGSVW